MWFDIYETDVPIIINTKDKEVCMDTEAYQNKFDKQMLKELSQVIDLFEQNIEELLEMAK